MELTLAFTRISVTSERWIINNWPEFKDVFKKQYRLQAKLEEIELSRNIIAHNNPVPDKEIERLKLNFDDMDSECSKTRTEVSAQSKRYRDCELIGDHSRQRNG